MGQENPLTGNMKTSQPELGQRILDTALRVGLESSWDAVRLYDVAEQLEIPLADVYSCYAQKDDLVEAFFDRADNALLSLPVPDTREATVPERLHRAMFTWFDALAGHRTLIPQMLGYKLEPLHVHLQVAGITRISRTVQWFMEAAGIDTPNPVRALEEFGLTTIYLATFACWINDSSQNQERSRDLLERKLNIASRIRF